MDKGKTSKKKRSTNSRKTIELLLKFKAKNLKNLDGWFDKSDPFLLLLEKDEETKEYKELGKTETINDNLDPDWKTPIHVVYDFGKKQTLKVEIRDLDSGGKSEIIGFATFTLSTVLADKFYQIDIKDNSGAKTGQLKVEYEKIEQQPYRYIIDLKAEKVKDIEWFSNSDPFLRIYKPEEAYKKLRTIKEIPREEWCLVYESEPIGDESNPDWKEFAVQASKFCYGDIETLMRIELWDYSKSGKHTFISMGFFVPKGFIGKTGLEIKTFDNKRKPAGNIIVEKFATEMDFTLLDYLDDGLQISTVIAIDFTASNGVYTDSKSKHSLEGENDYIKVIKSLGKVLETYDSDQMIPAYGFGAKSAEYGFKQVNHCFPISGNLKNAFAKGIEGVIDLYKKSLPKLKFLGPTYLCPLIKGISSSIKSRYTKDKMSYCILLIIMDGIISDMEETIEEIIDSSNYPLSLVIVGVGDEDFEPMRKLDGFGGVLKSGDKVSLRDIVQFVDLKDFGDNLEKLCDEVLGELPRQILEFYRINGLAPGST